MRTLIMIISTLILGVSIINADEKESDQVVTVRTISKLYEAGKYDEVYQDWCHPHIQEQLSKDEFVEMMKEEFGKGEIKLFASVVKALNEKAGPDVLLAQTQEEKDEYEFILVKVKEGNPIGGEGSSWHIELKLHEGKWKLMDTD